MKVVYKIKLGSDEKCLKIAGIWYVHVSIYNNHVSFTKNKHIFSIFSNQYKHIPLQTNINKCKPKKKKKRNKKIQVNSHTNKLSYKNTYMHNHTNILHMNTLKNILIHALYYNNIYNDIYTHLYKKKVRTQSHSYKAYIKSNF